MDQWTENFKVGSPMSELFDDLGFFSIFFRAVLGSALSIRIIWAICVHSHES